LATMGQASRAEAPPWWRLFFPVVSWGGGRWLLVGGGGQEVPFFGDPVEARKRTSSGPGSNCAGPFLFPLRGCDKDLFSSFGVGVARAPLSFFSSSSAEEIRLPFFRSSTAEKDLPSPSFWMIDRRRFTVQRGIKCRASFPFFFSLSRSALAKLSLREPPTEKERRLFFPFF